MPNDEASEDRYDVQPDVDPKGRSPFLEAWRGLPVEIRNEFHDTKVAVEHAELLVSVRREGRPRGAHDLVIAATARATDRIIVTADPAAFRGLPGIEIRGHR